jgi:hypothetical protein
VLLNRLPFQSYGNTGSEAKFSPDARRFSETVLPLIVRGQTSLLATSRIVRKTLSPEFLCPTQSDWIGNGSEV